MANDKKYQELVKNQPGTLVQKIVADTVSKDSVDVHLEDDDDSQWAVVKLHNYDDDTEMSIRLLEDNRWVLQFGYYDKDDEFIELLQPLSEAEINLIPKGFQKVMLKVVASEEGLRVPGSFLAL